MCSNGVYQLKKILLKYSETGHSSRNVRFFLRFILPDYRDENKHLNFEIQHEQYEEPTAIFEYINNSRYEISLKDIKSKHIVDVINLYKDSAGNSDYLKHGGPRVYSNKRSIQRYLKNIFCYPFKDSAPNTGVQSEGGHTAEAHMNSFYKFYKN
ncbi:hypothetical protein C922_02173 [Plasmodium inui San Antonio 1]|uniref:Large ribosomal subunit protein mL43 n=1 Tax=Plasmodium inui San Antonio 1 TaxID=1237626 RepID=W7A2L4_9APIC|nr:hypothetical protein C922_02173 [Plasmodium inui San Antonio 1]EUD67467.1 hypothetical protein C922_02173 [Plasmodium inui San Antonio 1]